MDRLDQRLTALGSLLGAPEPDADWSAAPGLLPTDDPALRISTCGRFCVVRSAGLWCVNRRTDGWWEHVADHRDLADAWAEILRQKDAPA